MLIGLAIAWGDSVAYLLLCVISDLRARARAVPLPADIDATPTAPNLHPVLLGALRCHDETSRGNESNAYETALGAVVAMIGRGEVRFEDKAPRGAAECGIDLVGRRRRGTHRRQNHGAADAEKPCATSAFAPSAPTLAHAPKPGGARECLRQPRAGALR